MTMTNSRLSVDPPEDSSISFHMSPTTDAVIRIDAKGFHYQGQFIDDAGEAHRLLVEFLRKHQPDADWTHAD